MLWLVYFVGVVGLGLAVVVGSRRIRTIVGCPLWLWYRGGLLGLMIGVCTVYVFVGLVFLGVVGVCLGVCLRI